MKKSKKSQKTQKAQKKALIDKVVKKARKKIAKPTTKIMARTAALCANMLEAYLVQKGFKPADAHWGGQMLFDSINKFAEQFDQVLLQREMMQQVMAHLAQGPGCDGDCENCKEDPKPTPPSDKN